MEHPRFFVFLFRYSSCFQDIHLIQDILFPTFAATKAIIKPKQAAMLMAMRRPVASASHPVSQNSSDELQVDY